MKRTAIILIAFTLVVGTSTALVGHNNSPEDEVSITSGGSASSTTGVSENGTEYTAKVEMEGRTQNITGNRIRNIDREDSRVQFEGTVAAGTPCHVIDHEVSRKNGEYVMNIKTVKDNLDRNNTLCAEVVTGINYSAEFKAEPGFKLEVQHNGETLKTFNRQRQEKSLLQKILALFRF